MPGISHARSSHPSCSTVKNQLFYPGGTVRSNSAHKGFICCVYCQFRYRLENRCKHDTLLSAHSKQLFQQWHNPRGCTYTNLGKDSSGSGIVLFPLFHPQPEQGMGVRSRISGCSQCAACRRQPPFVPEDSRGKSLPTRWRVIACHLPSGSENGI